MQKVNLYKYIRLDGGTTVSPNKPNAPYSVLFRLIADDGCILTDGVQNISVIDTDTPELYSEIQLSD